jgi:hydroxylaminobenzene mutase
MEDDAALHRQGQRLLQVGATLFLVALFVGAAIPTFAVPRLGLATHLLGIAQGTFLLVLGLVWTRLALAPRAARVGHGLAVYGCLAPWTANLLAAVWGAGSSMLPMAAGSARGSEVQELAIRVLLVSGAVSLVVTMVLVVWGLRLPGRQA